MHKNAIVTHQIPEDGLVKYININWDINLKKNLNAKERRELQDWLQTYNKQVKMQFRKNIAPVLVYGAACSGDSYVQYIGFYQTHQMYKKVRKLSHTAACSAIKCLEDIGALEVFVGGYDPIQTNKRYKSRYRFVDEVPDNIREICRRLIRGKSKVVFIDIDIEGYLDILENKTICTDIGEVWDIDISRIFIDSGRGYKIPKTLKILYDALPEKYQIPTNECFGGRYYFQTIQQKNKGLRAQVTVNGCSMVEYDYISLHLRMILQAYRLNNKMSVDHPFWELYYSEDQYETIAHKLSMDVPRKKVKHIINVILNTINDQNVFYSITQKYDEDEFNTNKAIVQEIRKILDSYMDGKSKQYIGAGKSTGTFLQYIDSCIMTELLTKTTEHGVVAFSIHDSLLFEDSAEEWVPRFMENTFETMLQINDPLYPTIVKKTVVG